jgi:hypothetical protein
MLPSKCMMIAYIVAHVCLIYFLDYNHSILKLNIGLCLFFFTSFLGAVFNKTEMPFGISYIFQQSLTYRFQVSRAGRKLNLLLAQASRAGLLQPFKVHSLKKTSFFRGMLNKYCNFFSILYIKSE